MAKAEGGHKSEAIVREPTGRLLLRFSGPAIISMTVASSYNLVDAIFIGRLGSVGLAAVTVVFPLLLTFISIAAGTGVGAASLISRRLGAGDREGANRVAGVTLTLTVLVCALTILICLPNLEAILRLLGAEGAVLPLAESYLTILVSFLFFSFFPPIVSSIVRAEGRPIFSSAVMVISSLINIALDPVLIFGLGPIPAMGIEGAATATVIARTVGAIIFGIYIVSGRTSYRFQPGYFWPDLRIIADIYRIGVASIIRSAGAFVVMGLANRTAASFGVTALAVMGVAIRATRFALMPTVGLGQGMLPLVGYNYGARKMERVGGLIVKTALASLTWMSLCWLVIMLFPGAVMSVFNSEPEFLAEGTGAIRLFMLVYFSVGVQMIPSFVFQAIGKGFPATVLTSARQVIFLLPALLVLPRVFGLTGLWLAFPISDALAFALSLLWGNIEARRLGIRLRYS